MPDAEHKPLDEFRHDKRLLGGRRYTCNTCARQPKPPSNPLPEKELIRLRRAVNLNDDGTPITQTYARKGHPL